MNVIEVILIGIVMLVGLAWQVAVLDKPGRLAVSGVVSAIIFVGTVVIATIRFFDHSSFGVGDWFGWIGKSIVFVIVCNVKSYLAPVVFTSVVSYAIYSLFESSHVKLLPVISVVLDWLFGKMPGWVEVLYGLFMLVCTGIAGFDVAADS